MHTPFKSARLGTSERSTGPPSSSILYTAYICFRICADDRGMRRSAVREREHRRRFSVAERVVRRVVQRRWVLDCSRREMGGKPAVLLHGRGSASILVGSMVCTVCNLARRVLFLGLVGGFDVLLCRRFDYSVRASRLNSTPWRVRISYTAGAKISYHCQETIVRYGHVSKQR